MAAKPTLVTITPDELEVGNTLVMLRQALKVAAIEPLNNRVGRQVGITVELAFGENGTTLIHEYRFGEDKLLISRPSP